MGYFAGRVLKVEIVSITKLLFYIVNPVVFFHNISTAKITNELLFIPCIFYFIACAICLAFYFIGSRIWSDDTKNVLALASGTGNLGYMMLPIIYIFFGEEMLPIFFLSVIGIALYENTLGFYMSAAGTHTIKQSVMKLLKLPSLYALLLALSVNATNVTIPETIRVFSKNVSVMYSILGMMTIGLSISNIKSFRIDFKIFSLCIAARFAVWPIAIFFLVLLDRYIFNTYSIKIHKLWMVTAFVPMGVNALIVATILDNKPEKIATALLITTISALLYIPVVLQIFV